MPIITRMGRSIMFRAAFFHGFSLPGLPSMNTVNFAIAAKTIRIRVIWR